MGKLREAFKPSDFKMSCHFFDTFGKSETETIARNVVLVCQKRGDAWGGFTWAEYEAECTHDARAGEEHTLDSFVRDDYLQKTDDVYRVNDSFLAAIIDYLKDD